MIEQKGLLFSPLTGANEIGINCNIYSCDGSLLIVDLGVTFSRSPERVWMTNIIDFVDSINVENIKGIVVTHAHEDHVGAVAYLWPYLLCPIYATPFTAYILREKFREREIQNPPIIEVPVDSRVDLQPYNIEFVSLTHSIPEPSAVFIRTPYGNIFHTGDWKIDDTPMIGEAINKEKMKSLGKEGVLALVCDSTNAQQPGSSGSERDVSEVLPDAFKNCPGRMIFSCFSSNIARIKSAYDAAKASGREVCLEGYSLRRMVEAAYYCGYLKKEEVQFVRSEDLGQYNPAQILIITTGSQAEPRAALTRMSLGTHPTIKLTKGDSVLFSARIIDSNADAIEDLKDRLSAQDVAVIEADDVYHVSGHPCQDELAAMYEWLKPEILIPVHGTPRHIRAHADFGRKQGIHRVIAPCNGQLYRLSSENGAELIGELPTGRLFVDGCRLLPQDSDVLIQRERLSIAGVMMIPLVLSLRKGSISSQHMISFGLFHTPEERTYWEGEIRSIIKAVFLPALGRLHSSRSEKSGSEQNYIRISDLNPAKRDTERAIRDAFFEQWKISPIIRLYCIV